ncbi:MAG TPA: GNAT family N-acetyltransferase [Candidatus Sulfotelmatobacter sp.]|nr:GNAT family N-acetyltransferase [Candidatus Sulfotelmatobacter sp.]
MADFTLAVGADADAHKIVEQGLKAYNVDVVGPYQYRNFELYARRSQDGAVIGGMFGQSGMDWLYVDFFWLDPSMRGSGLGSSLLAEAEAEAKRRDCVGLYLYTYSFQAPEFYRKCGYEIVGVLDDCPVGHQKIYLCKRLRPKA